MEILKGCGLRPKIRILIYRFWIEHAVLSKVGRCYVRTFKAWKGVTQGGPLSPTIFNIVVNSVVRVV